MTLEAIYYVTQIIAVGAILASLVAIWFQMQQSTKMARASAQREVLDRVSQFNRGLIDFEQFDPFLLGLAHGEAASVQSRATMEHHLFEFAFITEAAMNMHKDGFFSDGTWSGIESTMIGLMRTPGGALWWQYARKILGFEIASHLDQRLAQTDASAPTFLDFLPSYRLRLAEIEAPAGA